ncbi:hypothetical protein CDL15_Pgr026192 [Punica granatum]|uniref:Uncharacterized protein n=1 Tax=Punica granatum TaxID=22663 RepID=A0A218VS41_PUNGR|nr:hypothetical protein CDL15_Pgr026192 [Punica granatum]
MSDPKTAQSGLSRRVDPITLGANDHHGHLEGSLGYLEPLTLPQDSIGSLRDDIRPNLCQSGLFSFQSGLLRLFGSVQFLVGSVKAIRVCARPK